jgi:AcrR family transcriptional regulator
MSEKRRPAAAREKDLRLAMHRIERGRAHSRPSKLTISSVAREAGVSTSLIHNHYPGIAEAIRAAQGRDSRALRDAKHEELKTERDKNQELRREAETLRTDLKKLASLYSMALDKLRTLEAIARDPRISTTEASKKSPKR